LVLLKQAIKDTTRTMGREQTYNAAKTTEDRLGWTIMFIRAVEDVSLTAMQRHALAYPHLAKLVDHRNPNLRLNGGLDVVRKHAIHLAHSSITEDLAALDKSNDDLLRRTQRKDHILVRLKRLMPGASTSLQAMVDDTGAVTADPEEMATSLRDHWGTVFAERSIDKQLLDKWLKNATFPPQEKDLLPPGSAQWQVTREEVEAAIQQSGDGMPGPDRIPYKAWRKLGTLAIDILAEAAQALAGRDAQDLVRRAYATDSNNEGGHDFNLGILCCLPKKRTGIDADLGEYYEAAATRPLSLVNTDNRLLANAARIRWEPVFNAWVSEMQRGFLKGRSMIGNIVDVDYEAMTVSLKYERGALILFDFRAAFPSMSHEYMFEVLSRIGVPEDALNFIRALYDENKCLISCKGQLFHGFKLTAGIRQGCPLSPLLFVVVVDILLRMLQEIAPDALIRAFADDTATVVKDFFGQAEIIFETFHEFGAISGMQLNLPKTIIIPLWPQPLQEIQEHLTRVLPEWADVEIATASRYLGFMEGPGKRDKSWHKANQKFEERSSMWTGEGLGLQYSAMAYNMYAISVLSFLAQLEEPPAETYRIEKRALFRAATGPASWASPEDLWHLKECYGQARSFRSVRMMALASQARVAAVENLTVRGRCLKVRAADLDELLIKGEFIGRRMIWKDWYQRSHVFVLRNATEQLSEQGIKLERIMWELRRTNPSVIGAEPARPLSANLQKTIAKHLIAAGKPDAEDRVRDKITRWKLQGPPAHVSRRILGKLSRLGHLVTPRVAAACLSTLWNRWTTARRFQKRCRRENRCMLGCGGGAEDSIEHYSCCSIVRTVGAGYLRLWTDIGLSTFMLADARIQDDDALICVAILVYATYRSTNLFRPMGGADPSVAKDAMEQFCRDAVDGHALSRKILDARWVKEQRPVQTSKRARTNPH
jgi:hypothetical protein